MLTQNITTNIMKIIGNKPTTDIGLIMKNKIKLNILKTLRNKLKMNIVQILKNNIVIAKINRTKRTEMALITNLKLNLFGV